MKMTKHEFKDFFEMYFSHKEKNLETLEQFFFSCNMRLPEFPKGHVEEVKYAKEERFNPEEDTLIVDVKELYGDSWVFKNSNEDGKPYPKTMASLFMQDEPDKIPAPFVTKTEDGRYLTNDANHRIYAAYLKDQKIKIYIIGRL